MPTEGPVAGRQTDLLSGRQKYPINHVCYWWRGPPDPTSPGLAAVLFSASASTADLPVSMEDLPNLKFFGETPPLRNGPPKLTFCFTVTPKHRGVEALLRTAPKRRNLLGDRPEDLYDLSTAPVAPLPGRDRRT